MKRTEQLGRRFTTVAIILGVAVGVAISYGRGILSPLLGPNSPRLGLADGIEASVLLLAVSAALWAAVRIAYWLADMLPGFEE